MVKEQKMLYLVVTCCFQNVRKCSFELLAYFSKSKGCNVWDLDGKKYTDLASMSVGTNILGYANPKIDKERQKFNSQE